VQTLQLVGVGLQVVELHVPVLVLDILVGLGPDGREGGGTAGPGLGFAFALSFTLVLSFALPARFLVACLCRQSLQQNGRTPRGFFTAQDWRQRAPVGRKLYARQVREGRCKVGVYGQIFHLRCGSDPRSPDEEGYASGLLVGAVLPSFYAVLALLEAVIGGEEDVGVLQLPGRL
jgi:hypothetical protein